MFVGFCVALEAQRLQRGTKILVALVKTYRLVRQGVVETSFYYYYGVLPYYYRYCCLPFSNLYSYSGGGVLCCNVRCIAAANVVVVVFVLLVF